jgi:hypothetical protein
MREIEEFDISDREKNSIVSREAIIWSLENYSRAYLSRPKYNWPVYEFCYRSVLRALIDDLVERIRKEDRRVIDIVKDLEKRCELALMEPHGEVYKIYLDAIKELYDIVSPF